MEKAVLNCRINWGQCRISGDRESFTPTTQLLATRDRPVHHDSCNQRPGKPEKFFLRFVAIWANAAILFKRLLGQAGVAQW